MPEYSCFIQTIDLSFNKLSDLRPLAGVLLPCVESLDLSNNKILRIGEETFAGLANLRQLNLSFNLLEDVGDAFHRLERLEVVKVVGNRIKTAKPWMCAVKADVYLEWQLYLSKESTFAAISKYRS